MTSRSWAVPLVVAHALLSACSDDATKPPLGSGSGGANVGASGAPTAGNAASGAGGTPSGGSSGASGSAGASAGAPSGTLHLALFNVVTEAVEPGFEPLPASLPRVELPPRFTIAARVTSGIQSVRFSLAGVDTLDTSAPFLLTQDSGGQPAAWLPAFGNHQLKVATYVTADGSGAAAEELTQSIELSGQGMDATFTPTNQDTNDSWVAAELDDVMEPKTFAGSVGSLPYRLFTPQNYDAGVKYPVLVYLHGRGPRGSDNLGTYTSQLFRGPLSLVSPNAQHQFPCFVIVPQCGETPAHQEWAHWVGNSEAEPFAGLGADGSYQQHPEPWPSAQLVKELIQSLPDSLSVDLSRIYLTGESMGGFGTWEFTSRWPELFAAGAPMAGYSDRSQVPRILDMPFWVFHGDADSSNPVAGSRAMVQAINDAGGSAKYTEYAGVDHGGTFDKAWKDETELLPFLFSQRRAP